MERRTADPSAAPDFLSRLVASRTPCGFPYRKPHTLLSLAPRTGNPGALGMTKGEGSVHLSSCYKGLRELSAEREANDPSIHITNCRGRNKSTLCHPDPDFLYVAPSMTACAAFSKESRMRFANANELHRKSGGAKPRDLQFLSPLRRLAAQSTS